MRACDDYRRVRPEVVADLHAFRDQVSISLDRLAGTGTWNAENVHRLRKQLLPHTPMLTVLYDHLMITMACIWFEKAKETLDLDFLTTARTSRGRLEALDGPLRARRRPLPGNGWTQVRSRSATPRRRTRRCRSALRASPRRRGPAKGQREVRCVLEPRQQLSPHRQAPRRSSIPPSCLKVLDPRDKRRRDVAEAVRELQRLRVQSATIPHLERQLEDEPAQR